MPDERDPHREDRFPSVLGDPPKPEPILGPLSDLEPIFTSPDEPAAEPATATTATEKPRPTTEPTAPEEPAEPEEPRELPEIVKRLHNAARFFLTAGVFLVLIVFDPRTIDVFNLAKLTALWVFTAIAGGLWLAAVFVDRSAGERRPTLSLPQSWIVRGSLILLAITALATLLSSARVLSFFGLYHRFEGFVSLALYVAVLLLIVGLYRHRPHALREVVAAAGAAAVVVSGYVVLQRLGIDFESWQQVTGAQPDLPIGNLGNPALSGSFLGIALPFLVYLVSAASSWTTRLAWTVGGALVVGGLFLTQSRPGIVAGVVGILAMVVFGTNALKTQQKVVIVGAVLLVLAVAPLVAPGVIGPRASSRLSEMGPATPANRVHMWEAGWRMSIDRPLLGWGPEAFFGNYPRYRSATEARAQGLSITDKPHNIFLGWSTSTGFVGLLAYLALLGSALWLLAAGARRLVASYRALALTFGAGLCAYLAQGLYSIDVPPLALLGWVCLGALAVLLEVGRPPPIQAEATDDEEQLVPGPAPEKEPKKQEAQRSDVFTYCAVGVAVVAIIVLGVRPLRADHAAWAAERRAPVGWSVETMELYEKAIALDPAEAAYKGLAAFYLERVAGIQTAPFRGEEALLRAANLYEQANRLQPDNVYFMINTARVYARLGASVNAKYFTSADRWMGRAATIDGLDPQVHDVYADLLTQWASQAPSDSRQEIRQRARTQAEIARQLRAGRPIR
jgi:O-antigen ligase